MSFKIERALVLSSAIFFSAAAQAQTPDAAAPLPSTFHLRVHLLPDEPDLTLVKTQPSGAQTVCAAPCNTELALRASDKFVLAAPGMSDSEEFAFRPRDGEVTLQVRPGHRWMLFAGVPLMALGSFSIMTAAVGSLGDSSTATGEWTRGRTAFVIGTGLGGIALMAAGAVLLMHSSTTWSSN